MVHLGSSMSRTKDISKLHEQVAWVLRPSTTAAFLSSSLLTLGRSLIIRQQSFPDGAAQYMACCCPVAQSCLTLCDPMDCSTPGFPSPSPRSLLKLMSIESIMPSKHLLLCRPLLLPSIFPSLKVFSSESALCIRWPKYWSFSFSISPSNEYSGLISFRMDWLHLFAIQGTLKSLLQHHSSKASVLQCSAFFIVQLSHPYMLAGKTIALTRWIFVGK